MDVLTVNREVILKGDPTTLGVIFNKLVSEDKDYKRYVQSLLNVKIHGTVCLVNNRGEVVKQQQI